MDQLVEGFCQSGLLVLRLDVTTTGRPLTIRGLYPFAHFAFGLDHRVAAHARASATAVLPPRPSASAMAPATTRRCSSFRCGTTSKNRASSSRLASTRQLTSRV